MSIVLDRLRTSEITPDTFSKRVRNVMKTDHLRSQCKGEDNIKIDLQEVGCWDIDGIEPAQEKDRGRAIMNLTVSQVIENS